MLRQSSTIESPRSTSPFAWSGF